VANTVNSMSRRVIFQELHVVGGNIIQFIPFVHAFYAFESPFFYSHCNCEGDIIFIPFTMGTCLGDPLRETLFVLAHFKVLCFIGSCFLSCLFSSIVDNIHIMCPPSIVSFVYEHFHIKLRVIGLSIQP